MNSKISNTKNNNEVKLEITVEADKFKEGIKGAYLKNAKYFNIPGFRKGKAPQNIVEKHYGKEIFYEEAFNIIAQDAYEEAIKEHNLDVVSRPDIDITQIEADKDLIFTVVVQTKPDVVLGEYKGINIDKVEYKVSEQDISKELDDMASRNSRLVEVTDRGVKDGDSTVIDFEGSVDGVPFEGGKAQGHTLIIGSKTFIPGFEEQIIGMNVGEDKDIEVTFPQEYFSKNLSGKKAIFKVKLHEIKEKQVPEINDEFAKDVSEFDTLEELKKSISEKLEDQNKNKAKYETEEAAIKSVVDSSILEIPKGMIELEIDNMIKDLEQRLSYQGMDFEKYLSLVGKTEGEFRKEYKEQAQDNIKTRLVLEKIAETEQIEAQEEKINEKLTEMATMYNKKSEEIKENQNIMNYIKNNLIREATIEFLVSNAKIK